VLPAGPRSLRVGGERHQNKRGFRWVLGHSLGLDFQVTNVRSVHFHRGDACRITSLSDSAHLREHDAIRR
jgi:hypothetical protein